MNEMGIDRFWAHLGIRADCERFEIGTIEDLNMYGVGVELRF